jgi:hypothetical protein
MMGPPTLEIDGSKIVVESVPRAAKDEVVRWDKDVRRFRRRRNIISALG